MPQSVCVRVGGGREGSRRVLSGRAWSARLRNELWVVDGEEAALPRHRVDLHHLLKVELVLAAVQLEEPVGRVARGAVLVVRSDDGPRLAARQLAVRLEAIAEPDEDLAPHACWVGGGGSGYVNLASSFFTTAPQAPRTDPARVSHRHCGLANAL